jgi:hypothetical protein
MTVSGSGRASETRFTVEERLKEVSLLNLYPKTGRTHQIRVHMAAMGHPIVGDATYGADAAKAARFGVTRPLLHARELSLTHPTSHKPVTFEAPLPRDFRQARAAFRRVAMALLMTFAFQAVLRAENEDATTTSTARPKTHSSSGSTSSASAIRSVKRDLNSVKEQLNSLQADLATIKDQLAGIEAGLSQLDAARRLRDLERALPDMNAKLTAATNNSEEARSQAFDAARKIRTQQDTVDQMRDSVDRLQRAVNQQRNHEESQAQTQSDAAAVPTPTPSAGSSRSGGSNR